MRAVAAQFLFVMSTAAVSGPLAAPPSLCKPDERVVFSCSTGAHIVSLCASANASKTDGYLQYRFGRGGSVDLAYPDLSAKPGDAFTSGRLMFSGGGGAWLRFDKGPYAYTIFTAIGRWGSSGGPAAISGVAVEKDGKAFADFPCRSAPKSEIGSELFEKLGLREADPSQQFDIPDAFFPK
jgi:hypothetical protein